MKIQILQENLNKGLIISQRSISTKTQLPILSNVLLKTENNQLRISATNLETGINIWLGAKVEEEGEITVPSKIFSEIISSLKAETVNLSTQGNILEIVCGNYQASINCISADEFPQTPLVSKDKLFSISPSELLRAVTLVSLSSATDESRPVLTGILFKLQKNSLSMVATDGYRMSLKELPIDSNSEEDSQIIIPAKTLIEVSKIINDEKDLKDIEVYFTEDKNQVVFVFPQLNFFSRIIQGDFPDYNRIIPKEVLTKINISKDELLRGVKLVSVFARESANILKMEIKGNVIEISANSNQVGNNKFSIEAQVEGDNMEIAFNYRFLQGIISTIDKEDLVIEANGSLNPGVFKIKNEVNFLHLIMPVRLQSE